MEEATGPPVIPPAGTESAEAAVTPVRPEPSPKKAEAVTDEVPRMKALSAKVREPAAVKVDFVALEPNWEAPLTSSSWAGDDVPMPTEPPCLIRTRWEPPVFMTRSPP